MKLFNITFLTLFLLVCSLGQAQTNLGMYTGIELANFQFMEGDPYNPEGMYYDQNLSAEKTAIIQRKIGFIYENIWNDRAGFTWCLEAALGRNQSRERKAFNNTSSQEFLLPIEERMSSFKINVGIDFSVIGEFYYDPLQVIINVSFIQQFSTHRFSSPLENIETLDYLAYYPGYNSLSFQEYGSQSSFGTFAAIGPKINYQLNDDWCAFGLVQYNFNLVSSGGGDLVHANGLFMNGGLKYMF